jgi:hypothetical protein
MAMAFSIAAEIERDLISAKTKEALKARKLAGVKLGRPKGPGKSKFDPQSIEFFDVAAEVCDASMGYVQEHLGEIGDAFLPDSVWCPWGSELTRELTDIIE